MSVRSFLDTNVLIYTDDHDAPRKQKAALALIERCRADNNAVVSTQVLQEYFAAVTRKLSVPAPIARRKIEIFARLPVVRLDVPDILAAIDLHRLHSISFWDALIIRAALEGGCSVLYTEDLQDGWRIDDVEVINPFRN